MKGLDLYMKTTLKKIMGAALSAAILLTSFSACKKDGDDVNNANASGIVYRTKRKSEAKRS